MTKLTPQELAAGRNVMEQCLAVKPGESVLIVTDPARLDLADIFETAAGEITDKVEVVSFTGQTENAQEPPLEVAAKMKAADVALLVTSLSISHTQARKNACASGCRIASMPGITREMIIRTLRSDYSKIAALSQKLAEILTQGQTAVMTSPAGTNIRLGLGNRAGDADTGLFIKPGLWGNLPAGEGSIGPIESTAEGQLVFDGALAEVELDQPIIITIKKGQAIKISGGEAAKILQAQIEKVGPMAGQIGELGIGTNPLARLSPIILEAEKVYGTCHIALGNNQSYGGIINVPFHSDGLIKSPILTIDGRVIVRDNKVVI